MVGYGGPYGYQTDPDTGLMLLGHRFYDPSVGRFLTRDPIKDGRNWYGYGGGYGNPVNSVDPDGLMPFQADVVPTDEGLGWNHGLPGNDPWCDFFAGWGDTLTLGGTKIARRWLGEELGVGDANDSVDFGSSQYGWGQTVGTVNDVLLGGAGGWKAGAKRIGTEFSHTMPKRLLQPYADRGSKLAKKLIGKCRLNGNYVSPKFHARTDPHRYLKGERKATKQLLAQPLRALLRLPFWLSGGLAGGAMGVGYTA